MSKDPTVEEIRNRLRSAGPDELAVMERALASDSRKGVVSALKAARSRIEASEAERKRIESIYSFDREASESAGGLAVGLDEVGRGPLAGPLAVGAVVLDPDSEPIEGLNDSKQVHPGDRERIADEVKRKSLAWTVVYADPETIDSQGISQALRQAFIQALRTIEASVSLSVVLLDGLPQRIDARERNVVKGDSASACIAAASIVAKVSRDEVMSKLEDEYPGYGFAQNKGYGTDFHRSAIRELGLSPMHRKSFCTEFLQDSLF